MVSVNLTRKYEAVPVYTGYIAGQLHGVSIESVSA